MGVATVGLLYLAVRRWCSRDRRTHRRRGARAHAGRDADVPLQQPRRAARAAARGRGVHRRSARTEKASLRWLVATGVLVGFAFLTKSLQAFLAAARVRARLPASPHRRRCAGASVDLLLGRRSRWSWPAAGGWRSSSCGRRRTGPTSAARRPTPSCELIMGYNGLGRITGDETGSVTGGGGNAAPACGARPAGTGCSPARYGGQIAWLIPAALVLAAAVLVLRGRAPRTDTHRAPPRSSGPAGCCSPAPSSRSRRASSTSTTPWLSPRRSARSSASASWRSGGVREHARGAHHAGAHRRRHRRSGPRCCSRRSADWYPVAALRRPRARHRARRSRSCCSTALGRRAGYRRRVGAGLVAVLLAPAAYSVQTASTAHTGSLPTAGPDASAGGAAAARAAWAAVRRAAAGRPRRPQGQTPAAAAPAAVGQRRHRAAPGGPRWRRRRRAARRQHAERASCRPCCCRTPTATPGSRRPSARRPRRATSSPPSSR